MYEHTVELPELPKSKLTPKGRHRFIILEANRGEYKEAPTLQYVFELPDLETSHKEIYYTNNEEWLQKLHNQIAFAAGVPIGSKRKPEDYIGVHGYCIIVHDTYQGNTRAKIIKIEPLDQPKQLNHSPSPAPVNTANHLNTPPVTKAQLQSGLSQPEFVEDDPPFY